MKYTYRDECIISGKGEGDLGGIILVTVLVCGTVVFYLMGLGDYLLKWETNLLMGGIINTIIKFAVGWSVSSTIKKRRKKALAWRHKALAQGTCCSGKIINAGMEMRSEQEPNPYETWERFEPGGRYGKWEGNYRNVQNYWIDVEYIDPVSAEIKCLRANYMVRDMRHLIGCKVNVYLVKEWSDVLHKDLTRGYIDASIL
ncbi:MAG: hypothetical protein Q4G07_09855 [Oscillospiraceae bacterium]|nr:hypothetical protein [Oscillospiraceae bacterium]